MPRYAAATLHCHYAIYASHVQVSAAMLAAAYMSCLRRDATPRDAAAAADYFHACRFADAYACYATPPPLRTYAAAADADAAADAAPLSLPRRRRPLRRRFLSILPLLMFATLR